MTPRRRSTLGTRLAILCLGALGVLLLVLALTRPSAGRFLSAGLVLGAAAVVRHRMTHAGDPAAYTRADQVRSVVWSVVIAVVFVGASLLLSQLLDDG